MDLDQPKLIAEVKKRPGLWSVEHPTDRDEKLALWKQVGAVLYKDWDKISKAAMYDRVLYLQRKWRSLRDAFRRELRAQATGVRVHRTVYRYFNIMSFLGGFEGSTSTINANEQEEESNENIEQDSIEAQDEMEIEALEGEEHLEPFDDTDPDPLIGSIISSSNQSKPIKKRSSRLKAKKRRVDPPSSEDNDDHQELEMPVYTLDVRERGREAVSDSDRLFLMSFLPEMKQLPMNIKMWVRAQIANIMQEAVTCQYNNSTPEGLGIKRQRCDSLE